MIKRLFATIVVTAFAFAIGIFTFSVSVSEVEAQDYSGHTMTLGYAEYITNGESNAGGIEYFRQDLGNGQLTSDFVYGDPRRAEIVNGGNPGVTYAVLGNYSSDANLENQEFWMTESFNVWQNLSCSGLELVSNSAPQGVPGFVQGGGLYADVVQVGFADASNFAYFADPDNANVLGVAFTFVWIDGEGLPTDIDNNGKSDAALREIYYNDGFEWSDNGVGGERGSDIYDFPTVAIHEVGHGLSAAHFGNIGTNGSGSLVANPRAVMNAIYGGTFRELAGRDVGSHCSNWAQWPNN